MRTPLNTLRSMSIAGCLALGSFALPSLAQPTAFTYQGQLKDGVNSAEGLHDFRFRLFDAVSGGAQVGSTQCVDNLQVKDGVFMATVDFGNQFNSTAQRYIEILVRKDTGLDCSNTSGYATLAPRQPILPTPAATQAASAFSLAAPDGSHAKAVFVGNNGFVGIGTTTPGFPVHIASTFAVLGLQDTGPNSTQAGYVSYRNATGTETAWIGFGSAGDPDFSIVNARSGGDIVLNPFSGNVGVGTASPTSKLEVRGDIRLGPSGQFRATSGEENLRIVRGTVASNGSRFGGAGFESSRLATGEYRITFTTPFTSPPSVSGAVWQGVGFGAGYTVTLEDIGPHKDYVIVWVSQSDTSAVTDRKFDFIAVGTR